MQILRKGLFTSLAVSKSCAEELLVTSRTVSKFSLQMAIFSIFLQEIVSRRRYLVEGDPPMGVGHRVCPSSLHNQLGQPAVKSKGRVHLICLLGKSLD